MRKAASRPRAPEHPADDTPEARAWQKVGPLWQMGSLFHNCDRYPRKRKAPRVDRLAGILRHGLLAPAACPDGTVFSDLNLVMSGLDVPYDSLVFLHRFGPPSYLYTICEPGRFAVFVDPTLPVLTPEDMDEPWVQLCLDEVYVHERVPLERVTGIAVHPDDADGVLKEFAAEFRRLELPLYTYDAKVLWPSEPRR
jgi:hypothetical protein